MARKPTFSQPAPAPAAPPEPVTSAPPPPSCATCAHWGRLGDEPRGRCLRFPPSIPTPVLSASGPVCTFPVTLVDDRCGEHRPAG